MNEPLPQTAGLYIHLPFCVVKCTYCDFYSLVGQDDLAAAYLSALVREIGEFPARAGYRPAIASIFIGGGTPSHLPPGSIGGLLEAARRAFPVEAEAEVTVEANPESATAALLEDLRAAGANRLSIGVQSLRPELLAMMGRPHGPDAAGKAVAAARRAGFDNVSIDLIYGLPGQDRQAWRGDLAQALALETEHLSAYLLETDKETPLARTLAAGALPEPDADTIAALYEVTEETLTRAGFLPYEVSNWARPGRRCRHNLAYWTDRPYLGFGSSSHSYYLGARRACRLAAGAYIDAVASGLPTRETLDDGSVAVRLSEAIITALRLTEGADFDAIGARYGIDLWSRFEGALETLVARGWGLVEPPRVRLTRPGVLWSMDALAAFVGQGGGAPGPEAPASSRAL